MTSTDRNGTFGAALHAMPSYVLVPKQHIGKRESDGKHSDARHQERKHLPTWKTAMTFRSKRVVDCSAVHVGEKVLNKQVTSHHYENTGPGLSEPTKSVRQPLSWSHRRKAPNKQEKESEDQCDQPSLPQNTPTIIGEQSPHSEGSKFAGLHKPLPLPSLPREARPEPGFLPHVGRPLSAHPLLAMCVPQQGALAIPLFAGNPLSPRQLKRKRCWSSDEKRKKTKPKVAIEQEDKQIVLDAAVALSKLRVPSPLSNTSSCQLRPSAPHSNAVRMALPPPPFQLWNSKGHC
jgi:hypothetical protein